MVSSFSSGGAGLQLDGGAGSVGVIVRAMRAHREKTRLQHIGLEIVSNFAAAEDEEKGA